MCPIYTYFRPHQLHRRASDGKYKRLIRWLRRSQCARLSGSVLYTEALCLLAARPLWYNGVKKNSCTSTTSDRDRTPYCTTSFHRWMEQLSARYVIDCSCLVIQTDRRDVTYTYSDCDASDQQQVVCISSKVGDDLVVRLSLGCHLSPARPSRRVSSCLLL